MPANIFVTDIPLGVCLLIQTANTEYKLKRGVDGCTLEGNQTYCPKPTPAGIVGAIGVGLPMYFTTPAYPKDAVRTSLIKSITVQ